MKARAVERLPTPAWQFRAHVICQLLVLELWCDGFPVASRSVVIDQPLDTYKAELDAARAWLLAVTHAPDDTK